MSVYTEVSAQDVQFLLSQYSLGQYQSHQGISAGVENTNYFVETSSHSLVLTIFEKHSADELPFYLQLAEHLHRSDCPVPQPFRNEQNKFINWVKEKPCVFVERVAGKHLSPNTNTVSEIATALAKTHLATKAFSENKAHSHGRAWVVRHAQQEMPSLAQDDQLLLKQCLTFIEQIPTDLPQGVIHADLFQDNALFFNERLTGIIDWYFAGIDFYVLDLAICMNDWCTNKAHQYDQQLGELFLITYQKIRPLSTQELSHLPHCQIQAATRFWLSRLLAKKIHQQSDDKITVKNPDIMKNLAAQLISYT